MARKREWLNFWCPIGFGVFVAGSAMKWPEIGSELITVGVAIVAASLIHQRFRLVPSLLGAVLVGILAWELLRVADVRFSVPGPLALSTSQQATIRKYAVAPNGGDYVVQVWTDEPCGPCEEFSRSLAETFKGVPGWGFMLGQNFGTADLTHGVELVVTNTSKGIEAAGLIERAFQAAGVPFTVKHSSPSPRWPNPDITIEIHRP